MNTQKGFVTRNSYRWGFAETKGFANHYNHNQQRWEYRMCVGDKVVTTCGNHTGTLKHIGSSAEWCWVDWGDGEAKEIQYRQLLLESDYTTYSALNTTEIIQPTTHR